MVLHSNVHSRQRSGKLGASVSRVQIVGDRQVVEPNLVHRAHISNGSSEGFASGEMVEVPDVLARERLTLDDKG
jgi:hypothetical protein